MDTTETEKLRVLMEKLLNLNLIGEDDIQNGINLEEMQRIYSDYQEKEQIKITNKKEIKKELKRGKGNEIISLDELNFFANNTQEEEPEPEFEGVAPPTESILEKLERKSEFQQHGLAMSTLIGFEEEINAGKNGNFTLEESFRIRPVPIKNEKEDIDYEVLKEEEEKKKMVVEDFEIDFDELDEFLAENGVNDKEIKDGEEKMEIEEEAETIDNKEALICLEDILEPKMEEEEEEEEEKTNEKVEVEEEEEIKEEDFQFNFQKIKEDLNLKYRKLKPDFSKNYKLLTKEHFDEDGDSIEGVEFYWFDMCTSFSNPDKKYHLDILHIFGKMKVENKGKEELVSACITIKNTEITVYVVKAKRACSIKFEEEVQNKLKRLEFNNEIKITKRKKKYCFDLDIPTGEVECLELRYPYKYGKLKIPFKGLHYNGVFGESFDPVQTTVLEKGMKGPSWILVKDYKISQKNMGFSWCNIDMELDSIEDFELLPQSENLLPPNFKILSLNLSRNIESNSKYAQIDAMTMIEFSINSERKMENIGYPYILVVDNENKLGNDPKKVLELKKKFEIEDEETHLVICNSEVHLLRLFLQKLSIIDPDCYLGHELNSSIFNLLADRLKFRDIIFSDKIGRIKKSKEVMNFLSSNKTDNKSRTLTHGRLLIDTFALTSEFLRERDYQIQTLASKYLPNYSGYLKNLNYEVKKIDQKLDNLLLMNFLTIRLCENRKLIELTEELTKVSGCLWDVSLRNQKLSRNETLLMHKFNSLNYILPDYYKYSASKTQKEKIKMNSYQGGLVFPPKIGLYNEIILMLDFNSLYPSIIREFKICFTTVKRQKVKIGFYLNREEYELEYVDIEELMSHHFPDKIRDDDPSVSVLPKIVKELIDDRNNVKSLMKNLEENDPKYHYFDTQQQALKVISNSIYGCLGSPFSRFYSRSLAELVTYYGRVQLESAGTIVHGLGCKIVYGDTDSIFVNTRKRELKESMKIGLEIQKRINRKSKTRILEIGIDNVYKTLLLNNKKRYAGLCVKNIEEIMEKGEEIEPEYKIVIKGMDVIRREWCQMSKDIGNKLLDLILYNEKYYEKKIYKILEQAKSTLTSEKKINKIDLGQLTLHQKINKNLSLYTANTIPFINVARRLQVRKKLKDSELKGKIIPYLICKGEEIDTPIYDRAFHPEEYLQSQKEKEPLEIDGEWYLTSQISKPVMRILENVWHIDKKKISEILGNEHLFKQKNQNNEVETNNKNNLEDYSSFYDSYNKNYKVIEWNYENNEGKLMRNFLTFSSVKSKEFNEMRPEVLKNSIRGTISKIIQEYYTEPSLLCPNCEINDLNFSMNEDENKFCGDCESDLLFNKSSRDTNGNIYHIIKILEKSLKVKKINSSLKNVIINEIFPEISELREKSSYEKIDLKAILGNIWRRKDRRAIRGGAVNAHYKILRSYGGNK